MSPDHAATELERLAAFARRVAECDPAPAGEPAKRAKRLVARAYLLRRWPAVRAAFAARPPADDTLTASARLLADECRKKPSGMKIGWPTELLEQAARRLGQLADRLAAPPPPAGPVAALDATLAGWQQSDPLAAALAALDTELTGRTDAARDLLKELSESPPRHVADRVDGKLLPAAGWTPDARAAVYAASALCEWLSVKTSDLPTWEWVARWADGWFAAAGITGRLHVGELSIPGAVVEWVTLPTGKRVSLALAAAGPGGEVDEPPATPPDPPQADDPPPELVPDDPGGADPATEPPVEEANLKPLPAELDDLLRAAAAGLPHGELKGMVAALRAAFEGEYLQEAAVQLFIDYHGDAGDTARAADPTAAAAVGDRLADLLRNEFDLEAFHPANVHDLPGGWVTVAPGSRVVSGAVRRVLRPGLRDGRGNLRMPAVAEVE